MQIGKVAADDLRIVLGLLPVLEHEETEVRALLRAKRDQYFAADCDSATWCYFYEMPFSEHVSSIFIEIDAMDDVKMLTESSNPYQAGVAMLAKFDKELEAWEPSVAEREQLRPKWAVLAGRILSLTNNLRCLMAYGRYINDLIAEVREGEVPSLFRAVRIDPTVVGCHSVLARISQAAIENDRRFFKKLNAAFEGRLTKRSDQTYRRMRLVLQVLHETGAGRLSNEALYELFVKELKIYAETRKGDAGKALRKFANQYMKTATT